MNSMESVNLSLLTSLLEPHVELPCKVLIGAGCQVYVYLFGIHYGTSTPWQLREERERDVFPAPCAAVSVRKSVLTAARKAHYAICDRIKEIPVCCSPGHPETD